jgi:hypothetical protein
MLILQFNQLGEYCEIKVYTHTLASVRKCGLDKTPISSLPHWGGGVLRCLYSIWTLKTNFSIYIEFNCCLEYTLRKLFHLTEVNLICWLRKTFPTEKCRMSSMSDFDCASSEICRLILTNWSSCINYVLILLSINSHFDFFPYFLRVFYLLCSPPIPSSSLLLGYLASLTIGQLL